MIEPQDDAARAAMNETEQALRIAHENMMAHKLEHGC